MILDSFYDSMCLWFSTLSCSRTIDLLDWNSLINDRTKISNLLMIPNFEVSLANGPRIYMQR